MMRNFRLCIRVVPLKGIERAPENTMTSSFNPRKNQRTSKVMDVLELWANDDDDCSKGQVRDVFTNGWYLYSIEDACGWQVRHIQQQGDNKGLQITNKTILARIADVGFLFNHCRKWKTGNFVDLCSLSSSSIGRCLAIDLQRCSFTSQLLNDSLQYPSNH